METTAVPDSGLGNRKEKGRAVSSPFRYASMRILYSDPGPAVLFSVGEIIAVL
jgi:hypothetical protein